MKFTLSWLKDHLETDATLEEITDTLDMIGLEVESLDDRTAYKPFVIAKVLMAENTPMPTSCRYFRSIRAQAIRCR